MPDWPSGLVNPPLASVSTFGFQTMTGPPIIYTLSGYASNTYVTPGANTAIYAPFLLDRGALAQKMGVQVGTQSGNLDVGIYDEKGTRLVSKGSTAVAAAGLQVLDITDTWLDPGTYYMAMAVDNTTAAFFTSTLNLPLSRVCGVRWQTTAFALPATATFAVPTGAYLPWLTVQFAATL